MSKFYVGQRVRLARPVRPENKNKTGTIREFITPKLNIDGYMSNCNVDWDDGLRDGFDRGPRGRLLVTSTDQLEPLKPERNQTIAWSECVWKPEHMRAEA
jgi:hypothetical protein